MGKIAGGRARDPVARVLTMTSHTNPKRKGRVRRRREERNLYATPIFRTDAGASHRAVSDFRAVALFVRPVVLRSLRSGREAGREAGQEEGGQEEGEGEEESGGENQERLQTLEGRRRSLDHHR